MSISFFALLLTHACATTKPTCTARELRNQDCRLNVAPHHVRLLPETIAHDNGVAHTVDPMPLKGEGVAWEKATLLFEHGRAVLQLWLWDPGKGEAQVQSLHWFVGDLSTGAMKILGSGVVRRRRLKPTDEKLDEKKTSYLYDAWEKHSLKVTKDGKFEWQLGSDQKILEAKGH